MVCQLPVAPQGWRCPQVLRALLSVFTDISTPVL